MLKTCNVNDKYALISIEDILTELISKNCKMKEQLLEIYHSDRFDKNGNYRFKKNSKLYRYFKNNSNIIDGDTYISLERLSKAFMISNYEHNYEIEKKLKKYCRYYIDSLIKNE